MTRTSSPAPHSTEPKRIPVNRTLVGAIALTCLGAAAFLLARHGLDEEEWAMWIGGLTRAGIMMAAFWLALPTKHRDAAWAGISPLALVGVLLAIVAVVTKRYVLLPVLAAVAVVSFVLRPRRGPARPNRTTWQAPPPGFIRCGFCGRESPETNRYCPQCASTLKRDHEA